MNRRRFLASSGVAAFAALVPSVSHLALADVPNKTFEWKTNELTFTFDVTAGKLRQKRVVPVGAPLGAGDSYGVEVAFQCSGENSPDQGMKSGMGQPGARLIFAGTREESTPLGKRLVCTHTDPVLRLDVESFYESFAGVPVVRRYTRVRNAGTSPAGIEFLSSAMLHGLAAPQDYERELRIHLAVNSWMAEAQWHTLRPSEMGLVENERTSWSEAQAGSIGSWSSERYLPMAMAENTRLGLTWFWQIEHNGSWYWEISNVSARDNYADDVYAYLGGPDDLHSAAWKNLKPRETYKTVPVAIGCVRGGFGEAVAALTGYRRLACVKPSKTNVRCPVIFNDYMNCLWGDPTEAKELPLIAAASKAGCEYFVIDAGWYAEANEDWSQTIGAWEPSKTRWPHSLKFVLGRRSPDEPRQERATRSYKTSRLERFGGGARAGQGGKMNPTNEIVVTYVATNVLWMTRVIAAVASLLARALRPCPSSYRHALWIAALLLAVLVPFASLRGSRNNDEPRTVPVAEASTLHSAETAHSGNSSWTLWRQFRHGSQPVQFGPIFVWFVAALYVSFIFYRALLLYRGWWSLRAMLRRSCERPIPPAMHALVEQCHSLLGLKPVPILWSAEGKREA